ncbi:fimbrial biogenesis chaperone [Taibaiella soli]|nr:hypothetical protein [Taibaiella soli]
MKYFISLLFLLTACSVTAQISLSVAPARLFFDITGTRKTEKIKVFNNGKEKAIWQIYLQDWTRDSLGQKHFFPPNTLPHSCAADLIIFPSVLQIPPDSTGEVTVSIKDNFSLSQTDTSKHAMVVISQADDPAKLKDAAAKKQAAIMIKAEFAVHVYLLNGGSKKDVTIDQFYLQRDSAKNKLQVYVHNTGLQPLDTKVHIEFSNDATAKQWKLNEITAAILPGDIRIVSFALPDGLEKGMYSAMATVDCGEDVPLKIGELSFNWNE